MSYRELLEMAAKAAGLKIEKKYPATGFVLEGMHPNNRWNPLDDDADALRLAVKLELDLSLHGGFSLAGHIYRDQWHSVEGHGTDRYAATRRAIVRAAAEIGKAMP
jgi:hypothetical protein